MYISKHEVTTLLKCNDVFYVFVLFLFFFFVCFFNFIVFTDNFVCVLIFV